METPFSKTDRHDAIGFVDGEAQRSNRVKLDRGELLLVEAVKTDGDDAGVVTGLSGVVW